MSEYWVFRRLTCSQIDTVKAHIGFQWLVSKVVLSIVQDGPTASRRSSQQSLRRSSTEGRLGDRDDSKKSNFSREVPRDMLRRCSQTFTNYYCRCPDVCIFQFRVLGMPLQQFWSFVYGSIRLDDVVVEL